MMETQEDEDGNGGLPIKFKLGGVNIKLGGVNRPAPPNKLQQPNTKSIHRLSLTHLPLFVCRLPASVTSPWT